MSDHEPKRDQLAEAERLYFFVARMAAFVAGLFLLLYTAIFNFTGTWKDLAWAFISVGIMWPVVGAGVAQAFAVMRGSQKGARDER